MGISVAEMARRWRQLRIKDKLKDIVIASSEQIVSLNQNQLIGGIGRDGTELPYYADVRKSRGYGEMKMEKNPLNEGRYDMNLTGESFRNMKLDIEGDKYDINTTGHAMDFENGNPTNQPTSGRIFGLDADNKNEYRENVLYPDLAAAIEYETGVKFK